MRTIRWPFSWVYTPSVIRVPDDEGLGPTAQAIRDVLEAITLAEQVGLDFFGVGEHHRQTMPISSPSSVINTAAAVTTHIGLGSAVTVLATDDPVRVYQRHATAAALAPGRIEITAGRGTGDRLVPAVRLPAGGAPRRSPGWRTTRIPGSTTQSHPPVPADLGCSASVPRAPRRRSAGRREPHRRTELPPADEPVLRAVERPRRAGHAAPGPAGRVELGDVLDRTGSGQRPDLRPGRRQVLSTDHQGQPQLVLREIRLNGQVIGEAADRRGFLPPPRRTGRQGDAALGRCRLPPAAQVLHHPWRMGVHLPGLGATRDDLAAAQRPGHVRMSQL
jgi:hypothetical protein